MKLASLTLAGALALALAPAIVSGAGRPVVAVFAPSLPTPHVCFPRQDF